VVVVVIISIVVVVCIVVVIIVVVVVVVVRDAGQPGWPKKNGRPFGQLLAGCLKKKCNHDPKKKKKKHMFRL